MACTITRNAPMYDGTPRRERGYRAYVQVPFAYSDAEVSQRPGLRYIRSRIMKSPLFQTEAEAVDWAIEAERA